MSSPERVVILKQSGESFNGGNKNGAFWTPEARWNIAKSIAEAFHNRKTLGVSGITVVPGAGNIARGETLIAHDEQNGNGQKKQYPGLEFPDLYGRLFIFANAAVLTHDLQRLGVDVEPMAAHPMEFKDRHITFSAYNTQKVLDEHEAGKVVIIAGGTGEDEKTSDCAAASYGAEIKQIYPGGVVILKSTKYDGIFESDPAVAEEQGKPLPRHYKIISAADMLADPPRFKKSIDRPGLEVLQGTDLAFHVFAENQHTLVEVLSHEGRTPAETTIGTMVVGQACKPDFYD